MVDESKKQRTFTQVTGARVLCETKTFHSHFEINQVLRTLVHEAMTLVTSHYVLILVFFYVSRFKPIPDVGLTLSILVAET